jgi:polyribonucleotide nucleotidyltransferase
MDGSLPKRVEHDAMISRPIKPVRRKQEPINNFIQGVCIMMNIKKRSDTQEEFMNKKIEKSIRSAGADEKTARSISEGVKHREGMKTSEVRKHVIEKLTHQDARLGRAYEDYRKPVPAKQ